MAKSPNRFDEFLAETEEFHLSNSSKGFDLLTVRLPFSLVDSNLRKNSEIKHWASVTKDPVTGLCVCKMNVEGDVGCDAGWITLSLKLSKRFHRVN